MSRPLHRGVSGGKIAESSHYSWDSQMKDRTEKEDICRNRSSPCPSPDHKPLSLRLLLSLIFGENSSLKSGISENGFRSDPFKMGTSRSRHNLTMLFLKFSLGLIVILALSVWWTITISTSSRGYMLRGYRRLQEQLISDRACKSCSIESICC